MTSSTTPMTTALAPTTFETTAPFALPTLAELERAAATVYATLPPTP